MKVRHDVLDSLKVPFATAYAVKSPAMRGFRGDLVSVSLVCVGAVVLAEQRRALLAITVDSDDAAR